MSKKIEQGFTIVEVLTTLVVLAILIVPVGDFMINSYIDTLQTRTEIKLKLENVAATRTLSDEIKLGASFRATNTISDANKPSGWTTSSTDQVLIVSSLAVDSSNAIIKNASEVPYKNESIYFVSSGVLYVRSLANTAAPSNAMLTSCPAASATTSCPADRKIAENVKSMSFSLYDATNAPVSAATARSVNVNLSLEKKVSIPVTVNDTFRITLRNVE